MTTENNDEPVYLVSDLLQTERQPDGCRKLLRELKVNVHDKTITIPESFITDFSSIPWFGRFLVRWSKVDIAGVVHDRLYATAEYTRCEADTIWRQTALAGECHANIFQAWIGWFFLRIGGWFAWKSKRNKKRRA
ncbi:MAG: DUF1353 domain-containing protein [Planctomycetes bacterium]|nr:DUF1353 domain-containing protein [Planctomycetota bacterium]MCH9724844.1 DUF1353 domain-containing protein [Planctomycetota bacterium]MCH9778784.1 DUF1353 domain-containing protein [Planctomycetota bacterium]MCH9789249.1 DUF1353 domain-containing protein [Planctomycetota bacterium]MDF1744949.1 DUF1353 domain-containing protein [Gimesia sp.]